MTPDPLGNALPAALSARGALAWGLTALAVLVLGFGGWSIGSEITGAVLAPGQISTDRNRQIVQHPDGGVVASVAVRESQAVRAGDVLITLEGAHLRSELAITEAQLFEAQARQARLEAERDEAAAPLYPAALTALAAARPDVAGQIDGQNRLFAARKDTQARQSQQLDRRLDQIAAQVGGIAAQSTAGQVQLGLLEEELASRKSLLAKGLGQANPVRDLQRQIAAGQGALGELAAAKAAAEGRATEVALELLRLGAARREEAATALRELGPLLLELAERRRALAERIERLVIRAPVSGIVLDLQVTTPRAVLRPAEPVLTLIAQDRPLLAVTRVSPLNVDEVFVGQPVSLTFAALSARTTPVLAGKVVSISADALEDPRSGAAYFRAEVALDPGEAGRLNGQVLLPGMPVQAMIRTGARSPLEYLLKPFTDYFTLAFRES